MLSSEVLTKVSELLLVNKEFGLLDSRRLSLDFSVTSVDAFGVSSNCSIWYLGDVLNS